MIQQGPGIAVIFEKRLPFGTCVGVSIGDDVDDAVAMLHPDERTHALALKPMRRRTWVAGRIALQKALHSFGKYESPILNEVGGAPTLPIGMVGSISHKEHIAVALAAKDEGCGLGIDVEPLLPDRSMIARRILTPAEKERIEQLPQEQRWRQVLISFTAKEAIYKALGSSRQKGQGFRAYDILPESTGNIAVAHPFPQLDIRAHWVVIGDYLITTACVCPG